MSGDSLLLMWSLQTLVSPNSVEASEENRGHFGESGSVSSDGIRDCTRGLRWWHSYGKDLHPAACSTKCFHLWSLQANISMFIVSDSKKIKPCQSFVQCIVRLWVNTFNDTESSSTYSCTKRCKTMNINPQQRGSFFCLDSNSNLFLSHHLSLSLCWSLLSQSHYLSLKDQN